jgi:hypothetical protein
MGNPAEGEASLAVVSEYVCSQPCKFTYSSQHFKAIIRPLPKAEWTHIRVNDSGVLSFQHIIISADRNQRSWVDFLIAPLEEDDDPVQEDADD